MNGLIRLCATLAVQQTVHWLSTQSIVPMSREEAYALTSIVGDCRVTQVVDIRKGVHCMIPKAIFVNEPRTAPRHSRKTNFLSSPRPD